ncbi:MAG TPA: tetratricopeptide repeat protein [Methylomirabilota bacterium]|nr:tetratricopeptide repeat protein [Methylomirabilota bacterium]
MVTRWVFLFLLSWSCHAAERSAQALFDQANRAYEQKDYAEAARLYERLIQQNGSSAAVHFNLGNAFYRQEEVGRAVAHYLRAQRLNPRDGAIRANLRQAREAVEKKQARSVAATFSATPFMRPLEAALLLTVAVWIFCGVQIIAARKGKAEKSLAGGLLAIVAVASAAHCVWVVRHYKSMQAVAVANETAVRHGPLEESQVGFTVADGHELKVTGRKSDWVEVQDDRGRSGWVLSSSVELVGSN